MIKLYITNSAGTVDATQLVQNYSWSGNYQQCARTLNFGLLSSPIDQNIPVINCDLGNIVTFMQDDRTLFLGYIMARQKNTDDNVINITCYDKGIYLNRNEGVYKFSNITPEVIAKRICRDFDISIGSIADTGVKISRNFIGVKLYDIIQTAYTLAAETTKEAYQIRFEGANLSVIKKGVSDETLVIAGGSNLISCSTTESIENMINQVAIYNDKEELSNVVNDESLIKLYGLLQSYLPDCNGEDMDAKAKKILADYGVDQKITVNCIGNVANITGNAVVLREKYTGLYGVFYIDGDIHTWENGLYNNKLTLDFKKLMDEKEVGSLPNATGSKTA